MKAMRYNKEELETYKKRLDAIIASGTDEGLDELCFDIEYEQLEKKFWPKNVFYFYINTLKNKRVCAMSKSSYWVVSFFNDFDKLKNKYKISLLNFIKNKCESFTDEILRHAMSDLIARQFPSKKSIKIFYRWLCSDSPYKIHMAFVGFDILLRSKDLLNEKDIPRVQQYIIAADSK
jgi:hypothetical protein